MKLLFLTTHNLATNPRLLKEVQLALSKGYEIEIICFEFNNWSKEINERLLQQLGKVNIIKIPADRKPLLPWFFSVLKETIYRSAGKFFTLPLPALSRAVSRRSDLLLNEIKNVSRPDWVIGHNPGALWPAIQAAKNFNCRVGFDVEDYHPGEGDDKYLQKLNKLLMQKLLPRMNYVSFAATPIMQQVQADTCSKGLNWFTVLNYFSASEFKKPFDIATGPVKMVWFSQNINAGRGLELILPFVKNAKDAIELHLIGNLNADFYEGHLKGISNIIIHAPIKQANLHAALSGFDIGLALEPAKDRNNELAVSNKILAYLQAGLYVLATNTPAQKFFLDDLPAHGICFDYKINNAGIFFEKIMDGLATIRSQSNERFANFRNRNWEAASTSLLNAWNSKA